MDRKVKRGSRNQFFVVHVSRMDSRRGAVDFSVGFRRGDSHAAKKWMQRNLDSRPEFGDHAFTVERNDFYARVGKIIGQEARAKAKAVVGISNGEIDFLNADLEGIARLCTLDEYRAVQDVAARTLVCDLFIDIAQVLLHLVRRDAGFFQARGTVGEQGFKDNRVPGMNEQNGLSGRIVISPSNRLRRGLKGVSGALTKAKGRYQANKNKCAHVPPCWMSDTNAAISGGNMPTARQNRNLTAEAAEGRRRPQE